MRRMYRNRELGAWVLVEECRWCHSEFEMFAAAQWTPYSDLCPECRPVARLIESAYQKEAPSEFMQREFPTLAKYGGLRARGGFIL